MFEDIKVGDLVAYNHIDSGWYARRVDAVTKTTITVAGSKFSRSNGREIGSRWSRVTIENLSNRINDIKTDKAERERLSLAAKLSRFAWTELDREQLDKIIEIIS